MERERNWTSILGFHYQLLTFEIMAITLILAKAKEFFIKDSVQQISFQFVMCKLQLRKPLSLVLAINNEC